MNVGTNEKVAVVVSVFDEQDRVLCLLRSETDTWKPLHWGLPGGHMDRGEGPFSAAIRETREECNLVVEPYYCGVMLSDDGWTIYQYGARYAGGEVRLSFEHSDYRWLTLEEASKLEHVTPHLIESIEKALVEPE